MRRVTPKVFLVGETAINAGGMQDYLAHVGASEWKSDATSGAEIRIAFDQVAAICMKRWPNIFGDFKRNQKGEWVTENRKV
jgi:hypothetical protein